MKLNLFSYEISLNRIKKEFDENRYKENALIIQNVQPFTMTSAARVDTLIDAVDYINGSQIEGSFVECGVWKGGSAMAMLLKLNELGDKSRDIYLYDTFSGMSAPSEEDRKIGGEKAQEKYFRTLREDGTSDWCNAPIEEVEQNVRSTGYSYDKINFVKGDVCETLVNETKPSKIALLRLDTDWYESTKFELEVLYPLLNVGGVLIIDDYGKWQGARKAVDEYFQGKRRKILFVKVDNTGIMGVKQ